VTSEARQAWVETVVDMLKLRPIEYVLVGLPEGGGMSFEQKKRVSIGVELAANPAILFLDEPTTGLDSRAAQVVCRGIRRIARGGRSIVCTIHQPSYSIFEAFDSLLLLRRGGQTVYFGQLGEHCTNLIRYFESAPSVRPIQEQQNPASWMLEAIGAGTSTARVAVDFAQFYNESELCDANNRYNQELCGPDESDKDTPFDDSKYRTSVLHQLRWVGYKVFLQYWRTPSYNFSRLMICVIIALIFASAYPVQSYSSDVQTIARSAVIYVTW
jgi:ABC-type multidrug transport system ATPase subunit